MNWPMSERSRIAHVVRFVRKCQWHYCTYLWRQSVLWHFLCKFSLRAERREMAQLYTIGWAASEPKHGTSANQNPYTMFSLGERIGYGQRARTQYYQVWARGDVMRRLQKAGVKKGSLLWVSGSLELEEYTRKDGVTRDKGLRLELSDWGFVPSQGRTGQQPGQTADTTAQGPLPIPDSTIDGEREPLPE